MKFLAGILALILSVSASLAADPILELDGDTAIYNSLLWEISGNGLEKPCYLYGTMHVSQKLAFHLSDSFYVALQNCDMVALELNPETWISDIVDKELDMHNYGGLDFFGGNNDFYRQAFAPVFPENEFIGAALAADNMLLNNLLYRSSGGGMTEFEEETYLDLYIYQTGKKLGHDIRALEKYAEVMEFQRKAMQPSDEDDKLDTRKYLRELQREGKYPQQMLEDAYREGDLNMVDSLSTLLNPFANWNKYMLIERNKIMAHRMDSLMATQTLFTGVGAAHLPGEDGVIDLLRERGYVLRPIARKIGGKSRKYEQQIDRKDVPVTYQKVVGPDGLFAMKIPGEFYEMPGTANFRQFVYPDMANGSFYTVKRIRLNGLLRHQDMAYTKSRIDSLLYENIPGEILEQTDIVQNGWPAVEVHNKSRKGDHQRYRVVVTPLEVFIFKMGGTLEYVKRYGDEVFDSIEVLVKDGSEMVEIGPKEGGFKVVLPSNPVLSRHRNGEFPGLEYQASTPDGVVYTVYQRKLNDHNYIEEDLFELEQLALGLVEDEAFDTLSTTLTTFRGCPALDAVYYDSDSLHFVHARYFLKGENYYCLSRYSTENIPPVVFYKSFSFTDTHFLEALEPLEDSTLWFTCNSFPENPSAFDNMASLSGFMEMDLDDDGVDFSPTFTEKTLVNRDTGEEVFVKAKRYGRFTTFTDLGQLWEEEMLNLSEDSSLVVTGKELSRKDSLDVLEVLLTDTNSTRGIAVYLLHHKDKLFTLKSTIDTAHGPGPFFNEVVESFELRPDTAEVISVFDDKVELFFRYLSEGDSASVAESFDHMYELSFDERHFDRLVNLTLEFPFEHQDSDDRADMVDEVGLIDTDRSLAFIKSFYLEHQDVSALQLACLRALARMRSEESFALMAELLTENTPIPGSDYGLYSVYNPLRDTLELVPGIFDDIMALSVIDEYEGHNMRLAARLMNEDIIKPRDLKKYRKGYTLQARIELKRQRADEEGDDDGYLNKDKRYGDVNYDLVNYARILHPWCDKDPQVRDYIDGVLNTKNNFLHIRMSTLLASKGKTVNDTVWEHFAENHRTRFYLYETLERANLLSKFPEKYLTQESMVEACLWDDYTFESDTADVAFLRKEYVDAKGEEAGLYYFFKGTKKDYRDEKDWYLYVVGPQPQDLSRVDVEVLDARQLKRIDNDERIDEMIEDAIRDIEFSGRERYRKKSSGYEFGRYFE